MNKEFPRLIQFDGVRGVGKTTQSKLLSKYIKSFGYTTEIIRIYDFDNVMGFIVYTLEQLNNTDNIIIHDGSIARPIIQDMVSGLHRDKILEKYKEELRLLETIYHKYNTKGLILLNNNLNTCQERLVKRSKILQTTLHGIRDMLNESTILNLFSIFDDDTISRSNKFTVLTHSNETILEVYEDVLKKLS